MLGVLLAKRHGSERKRIEPVINGIANPALVERAGVRVVVRQHQVG